jgi:hypothetical protein
MKIHALFPIVGCRCGSMEAALMFTHYDAYPGIGYEEPLYKRAIYYLMLFLIGFLPGLLTGYLIWV